MKALKGLFLSTAILTSINANAERVKWIDNFTVSLNPAVQIQGPVYKNTQDGKFRYGTELAKILIQEGHKKAKRYLEYGDTKGYYAVMTAALTVPMHEGLLIHFREIQNDRSDGACNDKRNLGRRIQSSTAKKNFKKAFLRGSTPYLLKCRKMKNAPTLRQMMSGGADGSDVGIMQLSVRWHFDEFLAKDKFKSVRNTIDYGLAHLMKGFSKIYANASDYDCLMNRGKVNYEGLIRGSWAIYNAGNAGHTCRFADTRSPHAGKDKGFKENLDKTMALLDGRFFGYNESLSLDLDAETRAAVEEIVSNYKNGTNERTNIDRILEM